MSSSNGSILDESSSSFEEEEEIVVVLGVGVSPPRDFALAIVLRHREHDRGFNNFELVPKPTLFDDEVEVPIQKSGDFRRGETIDEVKPTAVVDGRRRVREGDAPRDGLVSRGNHARGGTTGSRTRLCRRRSSRYARVYYVVVVVARFVVGVDHARRLEV